MQAKDAVVARLCQLCQAQCIRPNELATRSGVTPSTVYSLLDVSRRDVSLLTVKKLCDGLDISLRDFFDDPLFGELEQEIR